MKQNNPFDLWFFGFGLTAVLTIMILAILQAKQRTRDLAPLAKRMGFTFRGDDWDGPNFPSTPRTSLLQRMFGGRFSNAMTGQKDGLLVCVFDYTYGSGKNSVTQTLACFTQDAELAPFELRPENIFDAIGDAITHNDIDFDSHPEFSRRYHLRAPDETRIRMLFSPSLLTYFEQIPADRKWHVEASGTNLILYKHRRTLEADQVEPFLEETSAIARAIFSNAGIKAAG
jgi:hypothetical protein